MKILVTGAFGYVGSLLVPKLLHEGFEVDALDADWFGYQPSYHYNIRVVRDDIRTMRELPRKNYGAVIHLAAVANDPCCELDGRLAWEVNALGTARVLEMAKNAGVSQFIYASSGSVYGVCDWPNVTEEAPLDPISDYNKTKLCAERIALSYSGDMRIQIIRPATVCGYAPRQRLDVVVNMLTMQALTRGEITVLGGDQVRPNIHIEDMTDLYVFMLRNPRLTGIWNAGFENLPVREIALMVAAETGARIVTQESNDPRSYRMDSSKLIDAGFRPKLGVSHAIADIVAAVANGKLRDEDRHYNLRVMKAKGIK